MSEDEIFADRVQRFRDAIATSPAIQSRLAAGQQFNCYESADNDEDEDDDQCRYLICIGPISNALYIGSVDDTRTANLIEAALKLASLAARSKGDA